MPWLIAMTAMEHQHAYLTHVCCAKIFEGRKPTKLRKISLIDSVATCRVLTSYFLGVAALARAQVAGAGGYNSNLAIKSGSILPESWDNARPWAGHRSPLLHAANITSYCRIAWRGAVSPLAHMSSLLINASLYSDLPLAFLAPSCPRAPSKSAHLFVWILDN